MNRRSSLRLMGWPMPPTSGDVRQLMFFSLPHLGGRELDRFHDVLITGATAEIARDAPANFFLARRWIFFEEDIRRHEHARRAVAALKTVLLLESFLQRMQGAVFAETFDGHQFAAVRLNGEHSA